MISLDDVINHHQICVFVVGTEDYGFMRVTVGHDGISHALFGWKSLVEEIPLVLEPDYMIGVVPKTPVNTTLK